MKSSKFSLDFATNEELLRELKKRSALVLAGTVADISRQTIPGSWGSDDRVTLLILKSK